MAERSVAESAERAGALRRGLTRFMLLFALFVAVAALTFFAVQTYFEVEEIALPDLTGMPLTQAMGQIRELDLVPLTFSENIAGVPVNTVTSQAPPPGSIVRRGRTIGVGVNSPPESALVPDLVGRMVDVAVQVARDAGLEVEEVSYVYDLAEAGRVLIQTPAAGQPLLDRSILLTVSRGQERASVAVPDLSGLGLEAARARLHSLGFTRVETLASTVSFERPGSVAGQYPAVGTVVPASTPVIVLYALGTNAVVRVPNVNGLPLWRAQVALRASGLEVGEVRYVRDPLQPPGVVALDPSTLTIVGAPIAVVINGEPGGPNILLGNPGDSETPPAGGPQPGEGASNDSRTVPFTFDVRSLGIPALIGQDFDLRLVVSDSRGERTLLDRRVNANEVVSTRVTVFGDEPLLQTYINGDLYLAWRP
jgi:beta-lactam-binding protein with PASTA domain